MNIFRQFSLGKFTLWLTKRQVSESAILAVIAIFVGITSGVGVLLFKKLYDLIYYTVFDGIGTPLGLFHQKQFILRISDDLAHWIGFNKIGVALGYIGNGMFIFAPVIGGLVVGLIAYFFIGRERYLGVGGIMEAVSLSGGRLPYKKIPAKTVASAVSIGFGASVGPADPSVQIGAYLGSMFGQILHLSDNRVRTLVASGAAGGIAAAFNAPITGLFFALEIIIGELSINAFGAVALAAVVSSVFTQAISGTQPAFHIPSYAFNSAWELPLYLGLGMLVGLGATFYIRFHHFTRFVFDKWRAPQWLKPTVAGLAVGLVGIYLPQVFGTGYDTIDKILNGKSLTITVLISLAFAKLVLTPVCISSGFHGGVFAPALFSGAMLGGAYGLIAEQLFPSLNISPPAFAMVGMATTLAGTVHAPITSFILLFEMTHDYRIILPLMFAVNASMFLSWHLQRDSVYTLGLTLKGIRLKQGRNIDVLESITVSEVMITRIATLRDSDSQKKAVDLLMQTQYHGLPVVNDIDELVGIITLQDINRYQNSNRCMEYTVGEICTRELLVVYPDETISMALRRIRVRDVSQLPVVSRDNQHRLMGLLRSADISQAYDLALTRREVNFA
ncbi:MAG: chloride channel protein [Planctomycetes bacterium]|nr:chloride channel protein [Planctomycetota bacterium]